MSVAVEVPPLEGHAVRLIRTGPVSFRGVCECGHPSTPCPAKNAQIDAAYRA